MGQYLRQFNVRIPLQTNVALQICFPRDRICIRCLTWLTIIELVPRAPLAIDIEHFRNSSEYPMERLRRDNRIRHPCDRITPRIPFHTLDSRFRIPCGIRSSDEKCPLSRNSSRGFTDGFPDAAVPVNRLYIRRGFQNATKVHGSANHKAFPRLRVQHFSHVGVCPLVFSVLRSYVKIHIRFYPEQCFHQTPTIVTAGLCRIHERSSRRSSCNGSMKMVTILQLVVHQLFYRIFKVWSVSNLSENNREVPKWTPTTIWTSS